jgi:hypothetical protein
MKAIKPKRCNYCREPATVWARYRGYIRPTGRPGSGGHIPLYIAACAAHDGCANWTGMLANHPEALIERAE